jgi:hypothetical protein
MLNAKRIFYLFLSLICCISLSGCGKEAEPTVSPTAGALQMGNPWVNYETLQEAQAAVGFTFPLPETVEGSYVAEEFRVCNGELLEVVYRDDTFEITVRMKAGEHEDISGIYGEFDHSEPFAEGTATGVVKYNDGDCARLKLLIFEGYSYSFYAPNGYWGDSAIGFAHFYGVN